jgi:hypothetical protein
LILVRTGQTCDIATYFTVYEVKKEGMFAGTKMGVVAFGRKRVTERLRLRNGEV